MLQFKGNFFYENIKNTVSVIISLFFLILPVLCFVYFYTNFNFSFPNIFIGSFLLHLFLLPLFFIIHDKNAWSYDFDNPRYTSWLHPKIIKQISLALIYPYVFGLYYSVIRYNRLGSDVYIDISKLGPYQYHIFSLLLVLPNCFIIFSKETGFVFSKLLELRNYLWSTFVELFYSFYIYILSKDYVFFTLHKIYKWYQYTSCFIGLNNESHWFSKEVLPWYRHIFSFIFYHFPKIMWVFCVVSVVLEFFFFRCILHYSLYVLFVAPILILLYYLLQNLKFSGFNRDVSLSDYLYINWMKDSVRFPEVFSSYVRCSENVFPFHIELNKNQQKRLTEIESDIPKNFHCFRKSTDFVDYKLQLVQRVYGHPWAVRFVANYYKQHSRRFFHSSSFSRGPQNNIPCPKPWMGITPLAKPLHPATSALCKTPFQKIAIYNSDHTHYEGIMRTEKRFGGSPLPKDIFVSGIKPPFPNEKSFTIHAETSLTSYFYPTEVMFGYKVSRFSSAIPISYIEPKQKRPDGTLDGRNSFTLDKRIHGYDHKAGKLDRTNNVVVSNKTKKDFSNLLDLHRNTYQDHFSSEHFSILNKLKTFYGDVPGQQHALFSNSLAFNGLQMPPLYSPDNFYTGYFSEKSQYTYTNAQNVVYTVSEYLKSQGIPEPTNKADWQDFFDNILPKVKKDLDIKFDINCWDNLDVVSSV